MRELYSDELSWYHRLFGVWRVNSDSFDTKWGYFSPKFGLSFKVNRGGYFSQRYTLTLCLIWGVFNIKLPFKTHLEESCDWFSYGFHIFGDTLHIELGKHVKLWELPIFSYIFEYHKIWVNDRKWVPYEYQSKDLYTERHRYQYELNDGTRQLVIATCFKECRQWHRKWLPFLKLKKEVIDVSFSAEVGEGTGSWKGGTLGCGYDLLPNEDIESCLRRMELERKFD